MKLDDMLDFIKSGKPFGQVEATPRPKSPSSSLFLLCCLLSLINPIPPPFSSGVLVNAIFLQIPNRTAALLVKAAMRIQKQSANSKPKTQNKNHGFGLFGSFLKRLTNRNRTRKREVHGEGGVQVSVNDILRWDSTVGRRKISSDQVEEKVESCLEVEDKSASLISIRRPSSAVWSETNEATSSSCSQSEEDTADTDYACNCEKLIAFCENPFRFVLQPTPPPSGSRTPEFTSPVTSPSLHKQEEGLKKSQAEVEEEEEKEQCSPVSVLDPPFQDDDEARDRDGEDDDDEDGCDLECSYANVPEEELYAIGFLQGGHWEGSKIQPNHKGNNCSSEEYPISKWSVPKQGWFLLSLL
ncbi:uncharacterized protein LOC125470825 [Pyrus x bretschneideri]|uniref:uncharacterized protein LOC125470825 n=1 Tax=Pyrus x bretschneideri TaxID=225117 RepID=UPI00202E4DC6|nr:uncharacterized protein LOC125470825 [Pyrus x bretschneideri]